MKEALCEGLWNEVVEDPLPAISKQGAEHTPLNPDANFPTKSELDRSLQRCLQKSGVPFLFHSVSQWGSVT